MIKIAKRLCLVAGFITLIFLVNSCSFLVDMYVMNLSGKKVTVEYKFPSAYSQLTLHPEMYQVRGSEKMYSLGRKVAGKVESDSLAGTVKVVMPDSMALHIGSVVNYLPSDTNYHWMVDYLIIRQEGSKDSLYISGDDFGHFFEEMPGRIYAIPLRKDVPLF